ncbi:MAG TPA: ATP-binding cassette domain-containing protein [Steroidobacteraceae bacterium]|jgi:subfamily B ATP-binding cassette protein HlyB/CyaB
MYWQPLSSATDTLGNDQFLPDVAIVDAEIIEQWCSRAQTTRQPLLRARYADLAWEITRYRKDLARRPDVAMARSAIDGYLDAVEGTLFVDDVYAWNYVERAIDLAASIGDRGRVTIGMLVAFQMFASRVSQPLLRIVGLWQQFQQASLSVARLGDIMDAPPEPYSLVPGRVRAGHGLIEMENLSFRYGPDLPLLLKGLTLRIDPGRVVAFMGPSGCGKSTLAKLLQGMYRPSEGRIQLDGTDITYLAANELRLNFGVVPQDTVLFSGTVYENLISAHPHATFPQVVKACQAAELHDTIERLPRGYQTELGERGVGLSGGQKQRLAIARALIKNPKILIFDEATSSLDIATAEHFCATINQLKGKVTMLFITDALPKNLQVDEIVQIGAARSVTPESIPPSLEAVGELA